MPYQDAAIEAAQARMDELELTQRDVAARAGVDLKTVNNFLTAKTWPRAMQRGRIEAALEWPNGTLQQIARGGSPPGQVRQGDDPNEEIIRSLPHLLPEDRDLFLDVYRTRRDEHTARRLKEYERLQANVKKSIQDPEVRERVAANFTVEIEKLRRAGYSRILDETES